MSKALLPHTHKRFETKTFFLVNWNVYIGSLKQTNTAIVFFRLFSDEVIEEIYNTTIRDVILRTNPDMHENDIQNNPFQWSVGKL